MRTVCRLVDRLNGLAATRGRDSPRRVIIIITYLAGSTQVFYALAENSVSLATALGSCFLPTLIGNVVGGVALVAAVKICMYL